MPQPIWNCPKDDFQAFTRGAKLKHLQGRGHSETRERESLKKFIEKAREDEGLPGKNSESYIDRQGNIRHQKKDLS